MSDEVLDASALLALLNAESGAERVAVGMSRSAISAVNLSEVVGKLCVAGMPEEAIHRALSGLGLQIMPFEEQQAYEAGLLRAATDGAGLSLGDRACLTLARRLSLPALTADRSWLKLSTGVEVRVIR